MDPSPTAPALTALRAADALLITAGAGMGVDLGLPGFRGPEDFWRAYLPFRALGRRDGQPAVVRPRPGMSVLPKAAAAASLPG